MMFMIVSQSFLWAAASALLVIAPETILGWFDLPQAAGTSALARVFGAELSGLTLVSYFTRDLIYTQQRKKLAIAYTVSNTLGSLVTIVAGVRGTLGGFIWVLSALYVIYAVAFAYWCFFDGKQRERQI
jgi:hypothetical protein